MLQALFDAPGHGVGFKFVHDLQYLANNPREIGEKAVDKAELNPIIAGMKQPEVPAMPLTEQLALVAQIYSDATKTSLSTLGTKLLKGGGRFHAILAGGDLNTKNYEKTMQWFSDNWPSATEWPSGVTRPTPVPPPAEPALQATG